MDDEPQSMGNTNSHAVMTGAGPGGDVSAAVTDTDTDEDTIAHQEIITAAVIGMTAGRTQSVIMLAVKRQVGVLSLVLFAIFKPCR